jgi:hypothetical protein
MERNRLEDKILGCLYGGADRYHERAKATDHWPHEI